MNLLKTYKFFNKFFFQGGNFVLSLTNGQYEMLISNGSLNGLNINPAQDAAGLWIIILNPADWAIFQTNSAKANAAAAGAPAVEVIPVSAGGAPVVSASEVSMVKSVPAAAPAQAAGTAPADSALNVSIQGVWKAANRGQHEIIQHEVKPLKFKTSKVKILEKLH